MKKQRIFLILSLVFITLLAWAVYDIMSRTTSPWERKKQRQAQENAKKLEKTPPKVQIKKD